MNDTTYILLPDSINILLHTCLTKFSNPESSFLSEEWQASAISIAVTYLVFVMGIPALVFQTFIPDSLRHIYNSRFENSWKQFLLLIILISILFLLSDPMVSECISRRFSSLPSAIFIFSSVLFILIWGALYLKKRFEATRNIEKSLSQKIVDGMLKKLENGDKIERKDIDDLTVLSKEIIAGTKKQSFLEQCERVVEELLKMEKQDTKQIIEILEKIVCVSVTYREEDLNRENVEKVMDILNLPNSPVYQRPNKEGSYLKVKIASCIKDIAVKEMLKNDTNAVMDAIEKLSDIDISAQELFSLGSEAIKHGHIQTAVAVATKLKGKVYRKLKGLDKEKTPDSHLFCAWLGMIAKLHAMNGSAREFAHTLLAAVPLETERIFALLKDAEDQFYLQADFSSIDAVRRLGKYLDLKRN